MKKILLLILFSYTISFAQYATPGTGVNWGLNDLVINSGGVVTGSFPNYEITEKITITQNDAVSVLPGSIVILNGANAGFDVNGIFKAEGTISDSIIFSSLIKDSTGAYNGFQFNDTAVDSESIISYARIEYAYYGMRAIGASPNYPKFLSVQMPPPNSA
jgi:hypothetical protein